MVVGTKVDMNKSHRDCSRNRENHAGSKKAAVIDLVSRMKVNISGYCICYDKQGPHEK